MKVHHQSGRMDAKAKSLSRNGFCVQLAILDASGRADAPPIASGRPLASGNAIWTQKYFPGKSLWFASCRSVGNWKKVMDLEAIFGLESGSASPPKPGTSQCLECSNTPAPDGDAAFEAYVSRAIERELGLPTGSLTLWEPW